MVVRYIEIENFRAFGARTRIPATSEGEFSAGINLFVGPNGSGKTTIMNALKHIFGRDSENTQGALTPGTRGVQPEDHTRERGKPWHVWGHVDCRSGTAPSGVMEVTGDGSSRKRRSFSKDGEPLPQTWDDDAGWCNDTPWSDFYDLGFPCGWPRQVRNLDQKCFGTRKERSPVFYAHHWPKIRQDVKDHLGFDPGDVNSLAGVDAARCPQCGTAAEDKERRTVGDRIQGGFGEPLLQGSDGQSHFLFLVMELRKFDELKRPTAFFLEEPDVFMHPALQKRFFDYLLVLHRERGDQFFITTHSPYMMDCAARHPREQGMVHLYRCRHTRDGAVVEKVDFKNSWDLLLDLGHRPADVMHPNGIIWVEGPSDRMYLQHWLNKYADQCKREPIRWGLDAEILWFGGSLVARLGFDPSAWDKVTETELGELVNLCLTHHNAAIVIDKDAGDDGSGSWKNKMRIKEQFIKSGRIARITGSRTIEGYMAGKYKCKFGINAEGPLPDRFDRVRTVRQYCKESKSDNLDAVVDRRSDIMEMLKELFNTVDGWRDKSPFRRT